MFIKLLFFFKDSRACGRIESSLLECAQESRMAQLDGKEAVKP